MINRSRGSGRPPGKRGTARGERAVQRAGLGDGITSHGFRHTFASLLIVRLRMDPVSVARQLGHSDPATTLRVYAHLFDKARHADELRARMETELGELLAAAPS